MVCNRCIIVIKQVLERLNIESSNVDLGLIITPLILTKDKIHELKISLAALGFELLDESKQQIIEKIKNTIINQVHHSDEHPRYNLSEILSKTIRKDYSYLSKLFSEVEGITIEKYMANQKIERVKELIIYDELNLNEIAYKLGYSSNAHLSNQFKNVTGLSPSHFKKMGQSKRKPIDKI